MTMEYIVIAIGFAVSIIIAFSAGVAVGAKHTSKTMVDMLSKEYHVMKK